MLWLYNLCISANIKSIISHSQAWSGPWRACTGFSAPSDGHCPWLSPLKRSAVYPPATGPSLILLSTRASSPLWDGWVSSSLWPILPSSSRKAWGWRQNDWSNESFPTNAQCIVAHTAVEAVCLQKVVHIKTNFWYIYLGHVRWAFQTDPRLCDVNK